ncbi:unnamed protein product [Calypogeia fissa]
MLEEDSIFRSTTKEEKEKEERKGEALRQAAMESLSSIDNFEEMGDGDNGEPSRVRKLKVKQKCKTGEMLEQKLADFLEEDKASRQREAGILESFMEAEAKQFRQLTMVVQESVIWIAGSDSQHSDITEDELLSDFREDQQLLPTLGEDMTDEELVEAAKQYLRYEEDMSTV